MKKKDVGYWNENTWGNDVLTWQQSVIRNTDPLNFEEARGAIVDLYKVMEIEPPSYANWFLVENPLVASAMYFYLLGKGELVDGITNFRNRHLSQIRQLEKLPKSKLKSIIPLLTVANLGEAWGPDVVDESVKVPHKGFGRSIFADMQFSRSDDPSFPNERSMETRAMDFVVPWMVSQRDVLADGKYEVVGNRKVDVQGFGSVSQEAQQELFMDNGFWQFIGNNLYHIFLNGYQDNPFVNMFLRLYQSCGPWIATESYVLMVDRPSATFLDGSRGTRHNPNGPAISWNGFDQYFLENQPVPPHWVEEGIRYEEVMNETNGEIRNIMLRHYGFHNYIRDSGATLIDSDTINGLPYELYQTQSPGRETIHLLKVVDASHMERNPETGEMERKVYAIPVSTEFNTCRECLADTARVSADKYNLLFET